MRPDQKAMLKSLWARGLMKIDPRCPRLCALMEEAEGVGLSPDQVKAFVKRMRRETGMNHWGREEIDLTVFIALTLDELRVRRGTSLRDEVNTLMALIGRGYAWGSGVSNQRCVEEEVAAAPAPMTISVVGQHTSSWWALLLLPVELGLHTERDSKSPPPLPPQLVTQFTGIATAPPEHIQGISRSNRSTALKAEGHPEAIKPLTGNTRRFFTYAKSALGKTSTGIPALQVDSVILETPEAKANALNDFFIKQTDLPGRSDPIPTFQPTTVPESVLDSLQLSEEEVRQQLRTLQVGKSGGHDKITPRLLRLVSDPISVPLTRLYNKSLLLGQVPTEWKKANLTRLVEEWTDAMDKGEIGGCVFLDLRKAFDKVWHAGLLSKLKSYGISGLMHDWFSSYLSDRKQRVVIQGATSTWKSPLAGVPQGSVLGPTLFILYINDLATSRTHCLANLYADDTSLSFSHHSVHRVVATLNRELSTVSTWLSTWKLEANIDKCKVMFITTRTLPQPIPL
ncbi:hypothetical protein Bbelb_369950 [Branchiostoma belcheri]|nr:hypothetical protein Bbelb_369950 [Branchiostoma belcheri]